MQLRIQDDILRRCLDFFGLRGVVPHDYESTILPTVNIGNLGQPTKYQLSVGTSVNSPWGAVPAGKCWRPLVATGSVVQAGGTVAIVYGISVALNGVLSMRFPFFRAQSNAADTSSDNLKRAMTLN